MTTKLSRRHFHRGRRNGPFIGGGRILDMDFDDASSSEENYSDDGPAIAADREEFPVDAFA
jgi:hypothetical protein